MTSRTDWLSIHIGDNREVLRTLPERSVHCVITSPPYWGLRDYGTATWEGGDSECPHLMSESRPRSERPNLTGAGIGNGGPSFDAQDYASRVYRDVCGKCGAQRVDQQLGLESSPEEYVDGLVDVFREVRRVLRDDGTVWLNLGDSYAAQRGGSAYPAETLAGGVNGYGDASAFRGRQIISGKTEDGQEGVASRLQPVAHRNARQYGLKHKDLVGIPWRVAFALQADGWYLRSDIIWSKPNPMPESVTDRPTKSHEYVFLLSKSERYFFDQEAVKEPLLSSPDVYLRAGASVRANHQYGEVAGRPLGPSSFATVPTGRNIRTVWTIPTQPYPGAHFAVFPQALVEPCIKAGTSEHGVCAECGAPWERIVELVGGQTTGRTAKQQEAADGKGILHARYPADGSVGQYQAAHHTVGWRPTCGHLEADKVPASVLDIFAGSGTVGLVANRLSRRAVLIDLNPDYLSQIETRNLQVPLGL